MNQTKGGTTNDTATFQANGLVLVLTRGEYRSIRLADGTPAESAAALWNASQGAADPSTLKVTWEEFGAIGSDEKQWRDREVMGTRGPVQWKYDKLIRQMSEGEQVRNVRLFEATLEHPEHPEFREIERRPVSGDVFAEDLDDHPPDIGD